MNIVATNAQGGMSALMPTTGHHDPAAVCQVLGLDGELLYSGTLDQCETFMQCEGLRPHCNCELVDLTDGACSPGYGWDDF